MKNYTEIKSTKPSLPVKKATSALLIVLTLALSAVFVNKYIFRSKASQDVVTITFEPQTKQVQINEEFVLGVNLNADQKQISGIDLRISYNDSELEYMPSSSILTVPENYFDDLVLQSTSGDNDKILRIVLTAKKADPNLVNNVLLSLRFKALAQSSSSIVSLVESVSGVVGLIGTDNDHRFSIDSNAAVTNIQINEAGPKLNLNLLFQGMVNIPSSTNEAKIKVSLGSESLAEKLEYDNVVVKAEMVNNVAIWKGTVNLTNIDLNAKYSVYIKGFTHMQKRFCELAPQVTGDGTDYNCEEDNISFVELENEADFSNVPLLVGDLPLPQNGILNAEDVAAIKECIETPSTACVAQTDQNLDAATNGTDFALILKSMGLEYEDEN